MALRLRLLLNDTTEAPAASRYAFAILLTLAAAALRALVPSVLSGTPYLAFYPAVVAAAAYGGTGPGLLATLGSALFVHVIFIDEALSVAMVAPTQLARLSLFAAGGVGISIVSGLRRASRMAEKRAERLRHESEERFHIAAENAQAVFGIVQDRQFIYANRYLAAISGYSNEEILKMDFLEMVHPDSRALIADYAARRQRGELVSSHYEFAMLTKSGETRWMDFAAGPTEYNGAPAIVGTAYDITERKRAEEALKHSEERYRSLFTSIDEAFCIVQMIFDENDRPIDYRYLEANPAFDKLTGLTDARGKTMRSLRPSHEEYWFQIYGEVAITGAATRFQNHAAELGFWYDVYAFRYGRPADRQVAMIFSNITEKRRADEQILAAHREAERARADAEEASRAKDHFLAVLSHELRNPLTPVLATAALLQEDETLDDEMRRQLEVIRRNAELEARLIDDLLDVTRITRGKLVLSTERTELSTVIHRAVEVCRPDLDSRGIQFDVDWGESGYWVDADPARLQQVFWNLIKNAIKFTSYGGRIGVKCRRVDGTAVVEVSDNGIGIEAGMLQIVFNAFEQAENRQFGGLGLGLAISKSLVEMHGGDITAHSDGKDKGAMFRVRLPLQVNSVPAGPASESPAPKPSGRAATVPLRILLVEDHGDTALVMKRLLRTDGHEVTLAGDVAMALSALSARTFDVLISDLGLPDGSGLDLLKAARCRGQLLPAIALSGFGQEQDLERSREAGFAAHLIKPASPDQLRATIARVTVSDVSAEMRP